MARSLFGLESEYALAGITKQGTGMEVDELSSQLIAFARDELPSLSGSRDGGLFLQNGSRLYVDSGFHPELATPECSSPWELVRYVRAGEQIVSGLARQIEESESEARSVRVYRGNVDYTTGSTWGCHESYLVESPPDRLLEDLVPHLVSRVVYTGAGGFHPHSPGLEFAVSPRAFNIVCVAGENSTSSRPIFHLKDERLAKAYHRLHILFGESLCSDTAAWLKIGATALVVAMSDAGLGPGSSVRLSRPLRALRTYARDTKGKAGARLADGNRITAVGIQRHYQRLAESNIGRAFMPPWAAEVCAEWGNILDRLEKGPASLARTLDWPIKHAIYSERLRRRGFDWTKTRQWTRWLRRFQSEIARTLYAGKSITHELLFRKDEPLERIVEKLSPVLRSQGLELTSLGAFLQLRQEMFEIDLRFGELGERGIFEIMDNEGVLEHRIRGVDRIEQALTEPPILGRARLRGDAIRRFSPEGDRYRAGWQFVSDSKENRFLNLADPFESEEKWEGPPSQL